MSTLYARLPRDSLTTIFDISVIASAACWGVICFGSGGVLMSRLASCSVRNVTDCGSGRSCTR